MMQQERAEDYVIGTGVSHTVEEFVQESFAYVGLDWRDYVEIDPRYFGPLK
jgi:GDPmannose 4,6-dehydratase